MSASKSTMIRHSPQKYPLRRQTKEFWDTTGRSDGLSAGSSLNTGENSINHRNGANDLAAWLRERLQIKSSNPTEEGRP